MKIATWNINGIKARVETLGKWLKEAEPDLVCLQEIKSVDEGFPREIFEDLGYNVATHGQKSFNGVAILSKYPMEITRGLPGDDDDEQARFIVADVSGPEKAFRFAGLYLPNGNPILDDAAPLESPKYAYKLDWMKRLENWTRAQLLLEEPLILAGDYNVIPTPDDVHNPQGWWGDALYRDETLAAYRSLLNLGLTDAFRAANPDAHSYSFWDYQRGAWNRNHGIRIDHMLLSPQAADCLQGCFIDKDVRGWDKPSDHVPVIGHFAF